MLKDKVVDFIHKEEDLIRHKLEDFEESQILKEEIQFGIGPKDREALAEKRAKERTEHEKEILEKRKKHHDEVEAKKEAKKMKANEQDHLADDIIFDKFMANNRL